MLKKMKDSRGTQQSNPSRHKVLLHLYVLSSAITGSQKGNWGWGCFPYYYKGEMQVDNILWSVVNVFLFMYLRGGMRERENVQFVCFVLFSDIHISPV